MRLLTAVALTQSNDTTATNVPQSPAASRGGQTSATSLFIMYMAIGFSVTFACILTIMMAYHWIRRSLPSHHSRILSRRNSSWSRQPQHEPKQMFVVQHPGGHANLAFREYEDLKPYKKKSCISVFSADLQDNSFTISAVKGNSRAEASDSTSALQPSGNDNTADKQTLPAMHYTSEHADSEPNPQAPLGIAAATTESPALQRPVAHTASQTSPKKCSNNQ